MITAKIIAHSTAPSGAEVITFELEYPRYVHAELMTHRVFSRNAASSRAIPIAKLIEQVRTNTVMPIWTMNQSGMQGKVVTSGPHIHELNTIWLQGATHAVKVADALAKAGAHKQNANRVLEPYQHIKTIVTTSDLSNWFSLRSHGDAQPEIKALSDAMMVEYHKSEPKLLKEGEWHLPYVTQEIAMAGNCGKDDITLAEAKMISASCCAQVSYRKNDDTLEKAKDVYSRLVTGKPIHASPFEHQCRPLEQFHEEQRGNLIGWRQLRQDIEDSH